MPPPRVRPDFFVPLAAALLLAACAGPTLAPDQAPEYLVTRADTAFYRYGPQQAGPPEARLQQGDRVRRLRDELGFSLVQLPNDGPTGYVANDALAPAPPLATPPAVAPQNLFPPPARVSEPPPVEPPLPKPDFNAPPADAPAR